MKTHFTMAIARPVLILAVALTGFAAAEVVFGQGVPIVEPLPSHDVKMKLTSGKHYHIGDGAESVWSEKVQVDGAQWLRLRFDQLLLAGSPLGGASSTLRITSLKDGVVQILDAESAKQWRNTSAYFNGDTVEIELIAAPNGRLNMLTVGSVTVGESLTADINATICDDNDDRVPSNDVRVGRAIPNGCTLWLFNDHNNCMLTAGHCAGGTDVASFNVPLSDENGQPQFPPPEDQYAVDFDSMQFVNGGIGNDWCYFGCFPNSNTGLTAFQAQGSSFKLAEPEEVQAGDMIRITGHGSTSFPVDPTLNGAQKTQVGPYTFFSNTSLSYRTDTTGGNSGSPVIFESTGNAVGIHTHGGCGSGGAGSNSGTSMLNAGLTNALANPMGVCRTAIEFSFPDGLPDFVAPNGGTTVAVVLDDSDIPAETGTATLHVGNNGAFGEFPMTDLGDGNFEAVFPISECGQPVDYYFSVESTTGIVFANPASAPSQSYTVLSANDMGKITFEDNFESDMNWTVSGDATTGQWERGIPVGNGNSGDPTADADGSGACYLTQNDPGNSDVDNGSTTLTSPVIDGSAGENERAVLSYFRWFNNNGGGDTFQVEISNDGGANWSSLELLGPGGSEVIGGWKFKIFNISDFVTPTDQMRVRFTASDLGGGSVVEAAVDGFSVRNIDCSGEILLGDVNLDGVISLLDVAPFIDLLSNGEFQAEADINQDGVVSLPDVAPFIALLAG